MKIAIIGAGNVGYHLGHALHGAGEEITQVFSRKLQKASLLAHKIGAEPIDDLSKLDAFSDLFIVAVHDDAIGTVGRKIAGLGLNHIIVAHTSGATPLTVFEHTGLSRFGVFYPLQTFSISKNPDFKNIPFCIDANSQEDKDLLTALASKLSPNVQQINDSQRAVLHLSAVFANNFSNHLFAIADRLLKEENMDMGLLLPLIQETVEKIKTNDPHKMQTGPAVRHDDKTIKKHLGQLEGRSNYQKIYNLITKSIQEEE